MLQWTNTWRGLWYQNTPGSGWIHYTKYKQLFSTRIIKANSMEWKTASTKLISIIITCSNKQTKRHNTSGGNYTRLLIFKIKISSKSFNLTSKAELIKCMWSYWNMCKSSASRCSSQTTSIVINYSCRMSGRICSCIIWRLVQPIVWGMPSKRLVYEFNFFKL